MLNSGHNSLLHTDARYDYARIHFFVDLLACSIRFGGLFSLRKRSRIFSASVLVLIMTFALFITNAFLSQDLSCNALSSFHPSQTVKSTSASRIELLSHLYPGSPHRDNWENENHKSMHALLACMSNDDCTENQTSIVILSPSHFIIAICEDCEKSGEDIWCVPISIASYSCNI